MLIILKVIGLAVLCFILIYVGMHIQNKIFDERLTNKFIFRTAFWGTVIAMIIALFNEKK